MISIWGRHGVGGALPDSAPVIVIISHDEEGTYADGVDARIMAAVGCDPDERTANDGEREMVFAFSDEAEARRAALAASAIPFECGIHVILHWTVKDTLNEEDASRRADAQIDAAIEADRLSFMALGTSEPQARVKAAEHGLANAALMLLRGLRAFSEEEYERVIAESRRPEKAPGPKAGA